MAHAPRSVSGWFRAEAFDNGGLWEVGDVSSTGAEFALRTTLLNETFYAEAGSDIQVSVPGSLDSWVYFTIQNDGTNTEFYVDGVLQSSVTRTLLTGPTKPFRIGVYQYNNDFNRYSDEYKGWIDEVTVAEVARHPDWIWASWRNQGETHDDFTCYTFVERQVPYADNADGAVVISTMSADLHGTMQSTGRASTVATIFYGLSDGGTNSGSWAMNEVFPTATNTGPFSTNVSGLAINTTYYYRVSASNSFGRFWATNSETFITADLNITANDPAALEDLFGDDPGQLTVSRPSHLTNGDLRVFYAVSGTATEGTDFQSLPGVVIIPDGSDSATIDINTIDDSDYSEGVETITLSLLPGPYLIGSSSNASVVVVDDDQLSDWEFKIKVRLCGYTGSSTLWNFPLLLRLSEELEGFSYSLLADAAGGGDLRFTDASEQFVLAHEIENWNPVGESTIWVRVPDFSSSDDYIWMYVGNPKAVSGFFSALHPSVWSDNYVGVWHMEATDSVDATHQRTGRHSYRRCV